MKEPELLPPLARESRSLIRAAIREKTQVKAAAAVGLSDTQFADWLGTHVDRFVCVLAALNLKVVGADERRFNPKRIAALKELAAIGLESIREDSDWGDL